MKVLLPTFGSDGGKSGIGQYLVNLLRALPAVAPDLEIDVLSFKEEEHLYVSDSSSVRVIVLGTDLRNPIRNLTWMQYALPRLCIRGEYDLVFFPAANRRLAFRLPCPSVGTFHDLAIRHLRGKYDWIHGLYSLRVLPIMVRRLSAIITDSECSKCDLVEYVGVPENRVSVIPLGVDTKRFEPHDKYECTKRARLRYGVNGPYLLYISRIEHPGKNHVRLIRAFEQVKREHQFPHQLVLAGSDWSGADAVHRAANESAYAADIVFTGFVPDEHIADLYGGADAFVFPSLFEGFGMPVLEAMACGIPVVCSNSSSLPEVAGDAAMLFEPTDVEEMASALRTVLTDSKTRNILINKGLERSALFSWENAAKKTVEVFQRVAHEHEHA
jgi:glycosyltransferase involved in cell wall biosynthesis